MPAISLNDGGGAAPATSPTIYWLDGKAYYSEAAYQDALLAKAKRQALAAAAKAAPKPAVAPAKPLAVTPAAAAAALSSAEAVRRMQDSARAEAVLRTEQKRLAALRANELRQLSVAGAGARRQRELIVEESQRRETARKQQEQRLAGARRQAYEALKRQVSAGLVLRNSKIAADQREVSREQERTAEGLAWQRRLANLPGGFDPKRAEPIRLRDEAVKKGESTGDWADAINMLDQQSASTGGRYVDQALLDAVNERYVAPVIAIGQQFEQAMREVQRLFEAEDMAGLRRMVESPEFKALEARFAEYFGDGRKPGTFAAHAEVLTRIAQRREQLWMGLLLDPSGRTTDEAGINRLLADAREKASEMHNQGVPHGRGDYHEGTLDEYLAREAAMQQDRQRRQFDESTRRLRSLQIQGRKSGRPVTVGYDSEGNLRMEDVKSRRNLDEVFRLLPGGERRFQAIVDARSDAAREELVRNFMRDASGAYDRAHAAEKSRLDAEDARLAAANVVVTRGKGAVYDTFGGQKAAWLTELKRTLLGPGAGDYGLMDQIGASYGLGDIFRAAQLPLAGILSTMRKARAEGFLGVKGDFSKPTVDVSLFGEDGLSFRLGQDATGGEEAYRQYIEGMKSSDANVRANAQRAYGLGVIGGNVGWIVEGLADPLNAIAPGAWLNRARLAVAASGGLRSLGGIEKALAEYAKYSAPKILGGYGGSRLRQDLTKMAIARETGMAASDLLGMSDESLRDLAAKALRSPEELAASDVFQRLLERSGIDREQLLNIVQEKLPKIADEYGLLAVDPFEMQARIRAAREGFARAEQQAVEAAQLEARRTAQAEARAALEAVRAEAGASLARRAALSGADVLQHDALLARYVGTAGEYALVARRAAKAADDLEAVVAAGKVDRGALLSAHEGLKQALGEMQRYEDQFSVGPGGLRELNSEGLVGKHYRELDEYRKSIGGDPSAPSYVNMSWALVRADRRLVVSRIRGLQRALAAASDQAEITRLRGLLTQAHRARVGVEFEAALLDHGRAVARTYGKRHVERVSQAIRPQRVAHQFGDASQLGVEVSRDLSNKLGSVAEVVPAPARAGGSAQAAEAAGHALEATSGADLESFVTALLRRRPGATFAGQAAGEVLDALRRLAADLGVNLSDLSLADLFVALARVQSTTSTKELWAGAMKLVEGRVSALVHAAGWRGSVNQYFDDLAAGHLRRGGAAGLARYELADKGVADALFALRKRRAVGQVRGGGKRYGEAELRELLRPDYDPAIVLAKMAELRKHGMDVFEYDSLRGVLRDVMLRRNTSLSLQREAEALARQSGRDVGEVFRELRAKRASAESMREFEEFASRAENQGRAPEQLLRLFEERYVGRDLGQVPGLKLNAYQVDALREAWQETAGFDFGDLAQRNARLQGSGLPVGNRVGMRAWLTENGYWSPRTGEQIASGERVWSVTEERAFFEKNWGYTPPWTDPEVLAPLLSDQRALKAAFGEWGFFDDGFEEIAAGLDLKPEELLDAVVFGRDGLKGKRTLPELRRWAVQRYGDLVGSIDADKNVILTRMPWLMRADDEYLDWMRKTLSEAGQQARSAEWLAARSGLPEPIAKAVFDGNQLSRFGLEVDRSLVRPEEIDKLGAAVTSATRRRLERLREAGDLPPGDWLPKEQLRFAYDVTNELLADPVWRGILRGTPALGAAFGIWGQFWRLLVSWVPAFPIMNLIDSFGFKRLYLQIFENGFRPLSIGAEGRRLVPSLSAIGAEADSLFHLAGGAKPWLKVGDKMLPARIRVRGALETVTNAPMTLSKWGEEQLRLDFARAMAERTFQAARKSGMDVSAAEAVARLDAKRLTAMFFVTGQGPSWLRALNQLVPFFTYNFNNKRLALRLLWEHPSVIAWGDRLAREIRDMNREAWEAGHPGVPFDESAPENGRLHIEIGGQMYTVDLSSFSDWTRAIINVTGSQNAADWFLEFVRVPHPEQLAMLAIFTGAKTPWGNPGSLRELSFWVDLLQWMNGVDYAEPRLQRDWIQITSQMLFFKKFGKIDPVKAKVQQYFWFRQLDAEKARAYLSENPDLQLYFDTHGSSRPHVGPETVTHWYSLLSDAERADYNASFEEWKALNEALDAKVFEFANQPWSPEYRDAKRLAFVARTEFLARHSILPDAWGMFMSAAEFAALEDNWKLDELQDAWFNWERPTKAAYRTELDYQRALVDYYDQREAYLKANPALAARLLEGKNAIENAWREQELQWSSILEFQAKLKVRILEEQEKPRPDQDRELIDLLYNVRDAASLELDAESYAQVYGVVLPGRSDAALQGIRGLLGLTGRGLIKRVAELPGFADFIYGRATPEERASIERNEWYAKAIAAVVAHAKDGKGFYEGLFKNPALLQEYWRRNPDARARYQAGQQYIRWISPWGRALQASNFQEAQALWDAMPAWVRQRYYDTHPGAQVRAIRGQEYFAAISGWVELLKARDYVAADRYFRAMPEWMREKYYAKHPDQRAQHELDSGMLRKGAEYFLAAGDDKLAILAKYPELRDWMTRWGGDEAAFRGLVTAMYRAIPSSEAWLKRTFRQRFPEIFGQAAAGERRLASVARKLAEHPEMDPFYQRAFALQSRLFAEQLKLSKTPPKPLEIERRRRLHKRSKRRAAALASHWSLHAGLRHPK